MTTAGPHQGTIADGPSPSDQRTPADGAPVETGLEHHPSHPGEHRGDNSEVPVVITRSTKIFCFCAALNSCNLGYDIGVSTNVGPLVQDSLELSDVQLEIFIGSINLFAMFGALGAHFISDRFGRRRSFVVAAIGFIIGVTILCLSQSYGLLLFGRSIVGLGVGFGLAIDPLYIAEISPASHRGELVTWSEIAINVGIVLGFAAGLVFSGVADDAAWRCMLALGAVLPIIMIFLATFVMPESPRWLIAKGRDEEAKQVLERVYPQDYDVSPVILDIKDAILRDTIAEKAMGWDVIFFPTPAIRRMLLVGVGTAISQQAVGIDALQYFLVRILDETGIKSREAQSGVLIFLGLVKLVCIVIAGKLFDRRGRRPLFFVSLGGMAVALLMLSINFFVSEYSAGFAVFALAIYLAFFSFGMGPGAWLIPSEVFATCIRAKAMSVATFMNRATATLMSSTFLSTAEAMTWGGFFLLLVAICMIVTLFLCVYLPETVGRSLEDMSVYFAEITNDTSILEAEDRIMQEREAKSSTEMTPTSRPTTGALPDATVPGTMA